MTKSCLTNLFICHASDFFQNGFAFKIGSFPQRSARRVVQQFLNGTFIVVPSKLQSKLCTAWMLAQDNRMRSNIDSRRKRDAARLAGGGTSRQGAVGGARGDEIGTQIFVQRPLLLVTGALFTAGHVNSSVVQEQIISLNNREVRPVKGNRACCSNQRLNDQALLHGAGGRKGTSTGAGTGTNSAAKEAGKLVNHGGLQHDECWVNSIYFVFGHDQSEKE